MSAQDSGTPSSRSLSPRQITAIVIAVITLVLILQNSQRVEMTLLMFSVRMPMWAATLVTLLIGVVVGWLLCGRRAKAQRGG